jgi:feruloyl esterase
VAGPPDTIQVADAAARCTTMATATVAAADIGLPTQGAIVTSATVVAAAGALPEYCRVRGDIVATNPADPPIKFQLNLPSSWNVKTLQLGGGGFNGSVVSGLGAVNGTPSSATAPLARGYATFGSDSGNQQPNGAFGTNAQAVVNYGGEAVKRARDAAVALMKAYYAAAPWKVYYAGASKGGHEALVAAQRYGADYDGVIAYYPANQNQAMVLSWYRMWQAAYTVPGGYMNPAKQALLKSKVMEVCDGLDGLVDGLVGNTRACDHTFTPNALRCPGGADTGDTCLSDPQINALVTAATPMTFAFPLANGVTTMGAYPVYHGGDISAWLDATGVGNSSYRGFFDPVLRYFDQQDPLSSSDNFNYLAWQPRVQELSQVMDATDPRLEAFRDKGAKMIFVQGTTDMLVTHNTSSDYVERLKARFGATLPDFVRYYLVPGYAHGSGDWRSTWDSLSALEAWAERGEAPVNPVTVDANAANGGRSRPLCEYPQFPKYNGSGDPLLATSFSCSAS